MNIDTDFTTITYDVADVASYVATIKPAGKVSARSPPNTGYTHRCTGTGTSCVRVRAWKRVVEDGTRGATAFGGEEGWPVAPRNCQLTFLPPCKKTRSYVPVYVATAHEPHDELARQGSTDPGREEKRDSPPLE